MASSVVSWAGAAVVVCTALAGCGTSNPGTGASAASSATSSSATAAGTTAQTTASTSSQSPTSRPTGTADSSAGGRPCANGDLSVALGRSRAASGHVAVAIGFRNLSSSACSLSGYPGVAALDGQGRQVEQAVRSASGFLGGSYTVRTVTVPVGGDASALVEGTDVPTGTKTACTTFAGLLATAPGQTRSHVLRLSFPGCSPIQVHPVVSGADGRA